MPKTDELLRMIPNVDRLLRHETIGQSGISRTAAAEAVRDVLSGLRARILASETDEIPEDGALCAQAVRLAREQNGAGLRRVINGTGVLLHSNLGRACMSCRAAEAAYKAACGYSALEYDLAGGGRGLRAKSALERLCRLTLAQSALIVNNNAASVLLILSALARGGNVIVSRGELVEIGGAFRVPEIIAQCGCQLREVGTTNKTRVSDYARAIDENTRALLKVHASNFKIVGFTQSASVKELASLGQERGLPVIEDIGSGALVRMDKYGIPDEPFAQDSLREGADVVCFSGDKLLGGPQCGIILGGDAYLSVMRTHPLYRALRVDKMTIAALDETLRAYEEQDTAERELPVLSMLSAAPETLRTRAERLCALLAERGVPAEITESESVAGGGSTPGTTLPSYAVAFSELKAIDLERSLRLSDIPILGRIVKGRYMLDVRAMFDRDIETAADAAARALGGV